MNFLDIHIASRKQFELNCGYQPYSSIFYLINGSFEIELDGSVYVAKKGDIVYLPKNLYFKRKVIEKISFYYLRFWGDEQYAAMGGMLKTNHLPTFEETLKCLMQNTEQNDDIQYAKNIVLESIFCQLKLKAPDETKCNDPSILKCISYIDTGFAEDIALETLSDISGYSKTILIEKFKKYYHITPIQYLTEVRLKRAKQELVDQNHSISEIAERCGFHCPYYFSNVFKKHFGESPSQYRKRYSI